MAYQFTSNAFASGEPPVVHPYTGVIRDDGRWCPCCAAGHTDDVTGITYGQMWQDYLTWAATPANVPLPYQSPASGGLSIALQPGEVAIGSMLDSMPPQTQFPAAAQPAAPPASGHREAHTASVTVEHSTTTVSGRAHRDG